MRPSVPIGTYGTATRINHNGYIVRRVKTERGWRYVMEHRLIWEATNGPIPPGHVIHHRNGIPTDNRLENLELVASNSEHHRRFHAKRPPSHAARMSAAHKGKPKSPEHRAKIAAAHKGKTKTPEHRAKLAAALRGRKRPDIAARLTGRKVSEAEREIHRRDILTRPRDPLTGRILPSS